MALKSERGQTVVEYILLLAVVVSLIITFRNSELFRRMFGTGGTIGQRMKQESEFSYRHAYGHGAVDVPRLTRDGAVHPSYHDADGGQTRFFGAREPYP